MRRLSIALLASAAVAGGVVGSAQANPGDVLRTLNVPSHDVSIATDDGGNLYFASSSPDVLWKCDANGGNLTSIPLPWPAGELAHDCESGLLWTAKLQYGTNPVEIYTINPANGQTTFKWYAPQMDPNKISDGEAIDTDGTIWFSDDGGDVEYHYRMSDGAFLGTLTPLGPNGQPFAPDNVSGICVGPGNRMYVMVHEAGVLGWVDKTSGVWEGQLNSGFTNGAEGLECDALDFSPKVVLWLDASANQLIAIEADPGTCVVCGATATQGATWGSVKAIYR